jgi:hypothetical protein
MEARTTMIRLHGSYYLLTGLWPLLHLRSFEAVTGPKADRFVLRAASALFTVIGGFMVVEARSDPRATARLGALTAAATATVSLRHWPAIRAVYVVDAVVQFGLGATSLALTRTR